MPGVAQAKGGTSIGAVGEGEDGAGPGTEAAAAVAASVPRAMTTAPPNISVIGPPWTRRCRRVVAADTTARGGASTAAAAKSAANATATAAAATEAIFSATAAAHPRRAFRPPAAAAIRPTGRPKSRGVGTISGTIFGTIAGATGEGGGGARTAPRACRGMTWTESTWRTASGMTTGAARLTAGVCLTMGSGGAAGPSSLRRGKVLTGAGWYVSTWGNYFCKASASTVDVACRAGVKFVCKVSTNATALRIVRKVHCCA